MSHSRVLRRRFQHATRSNSMSQPASRVHLAGAGARSARLARARRAASVARGPTRAAACIGDGQPCLAAIGDVLEPVASDVVGRQYRAGDLGTAHPGDPRGQEQLLELGSGGRALPVARAGEPIGVTDRQLQYAGGAGCEIVQRGAGRPIHQEHGDRPVPEPEGHHGPDLARCEIALERREMAGRDLRPRHLRDRHLLREGARSGEPPQGDPFQIHDVESRPAPPPSAPRSRRSRPAGHRWAARGDPPPSGSHAPASTARLPAVLECVLGAKSGSASRRARPRAARHG